MWVDASGVKTPIPSLSNPHLVNIIGFLERKMGIQRFLHPEQFDDTPIEEECKIVYASYSLLVEEAKKRGLL